MMPPRKRLRTCRGGGGGCGGWGRFVLCVALVLVPRVFPLCQGDASVPTPHPHRSRPYGYDYPPPFLFVAAHGADWLKDAGAAFRRTLFCQWRRLVLAATLHLCQQLDHFSTQGRCVFNGKLAVRVAQDAVGWSLHKIVFERSEERRVGK